MLVAKDSLDFLVVLVLFLQLFGVGNALFLAREKWLDLLTCIRFPNAQVGVFAA